jgi:hypothetical protein
MFPYKKLNQWHKHKCFKLLDQVKEKENLGKEELIKYVLLDKISQENHLNIKNSFDQWVYDLNKPT